MKVTFLTTAFSLASVFGLAAAQITLKPFQGVVEIGETYILNWTAEASYGYDIWLIRAINAENEDSWVQEKSLERNITFPTLSPSYAFTVPSNLSFIEKYGLWLNTVYHEEDYNAQTAYFDIAPIDSPAANATTSATPSATSAMATHSETSSAASSTPSSVHHKSISGGAIAGIVIGCLLAIALIFGAALLFKRHQKSSSVKKREAEARANRLAPVMEAGSPSFEMHGRSPQVLKETNV